MRPVCRLRTPVLAFNCNGTAHQPGERGELSADGPPWSTAHHRSHPGASLSQPGAFKHTHAHTLKYLHTPSCAHNTHSYKHTRHHNHTHKYTITHTHKYPPPIQIYTLTWIHVQHTLTPLTRTPSPCTHSHTTHMDIHHKFTFMDTEHTLRHISTLTDTYTHTVTQTHTRKCTLTPYSNTHSHRYISTHLHIPLTHMLHPLSQGTSQVPSTHRAQTRAA